MQADLSIDITVNWRKGTLWPYESMAAIGAKFCYLNRIPASRFRQFLLKFTEKLSSADFAGVVDKADFSTEAFARALREPVVRVRQLSPSQFSLSGVSPAIPTYKNGIAVAPPLYYCPDCARMGYISCFHQSRFLRKCLIHGAELLTIELEKDSQYIIDRQILAAFKLLFETSGWKFREYDAWQPNLGADGWSNVDEYLSLLAASRISIAAKQERLIATSIAGAMKWSEAVDIVREALPSGAFPEHIEHCLLTSRHRISRIMISQNGHNGASRLANKLAQVTSFEDVAMAWKEWSLLLGISTPWRTTAQRAIGEMLMGHEACWMAFTQLRLPACRSTPSVKYEIQNVCRRVVVIQYLHDCWLTPWLLHANSDFYGYIEPWSALKNSVGQELERLKLAQKEVVPVICVGPDGIPAVYQVEVWRLSSSLQEIVDSILQQRLERDILSEWLSINKTWPYDDKWSLYQGTNEAVELEIWTRRSMALPDWIKIPSVDGELKSINNLVKARNCNCPHIS